MSMKLSLALLASALILSGCVSSTITNLTPAQQRRNAENLYPVEAAFETRERAVRKETIRPYVIVGMNAYPMDRTPLLSNRWEVLVPVPLDADQVHYRFKFDYDYLSMPQRRSSSRLSPTYQLQIENGVPR
jgi:hypothetical protein